GGARRRLDDCCNLDRWRAHSGRPPSGQGCIRRRCPRRRHRNARYGEWNNPSATLASVRASALRIAADNGFANNGVNSVVTVNSPPTSGAYAGQSGYIEVIIESKIDRGFSRLLGSDPLSAYARSVGAGTYVPTQGSVLV